MWKAALQWVINPRNLATVGISAFLAFQAGEMYAAIGKQIEIAAAKKEARAAQKAETETAERKACEATLEQQREETDAIYADLDAADRARADLLRQYSNALTAFDQATGRAVSGAGAAGAAGSAKAVPPAGHGGDHGRTADLINDFTTWQKERVMLRAFQEKCK